MNNTKIKLKETRYYINKYGVFYEGQELSHYWSCKQGLYYDKQVILQKFIFHYDKVYRNKFKMYCRFIEAGKSSDYYKFTVPVEHLGVFYKNT